MFYMGLVGFFLGLLSLSYVTRMYELCFSKVEQGAYLGLATSLGLWSSHYGEQGLFLVFGIILLGGATIDHKLYILPLEGCCTLAIIGLYHGYLMHTFWPFAMMQVVIVGLLGWLLRSCSHEGFGLGDVYWLMALALWYTPWGTWIMLTLSFLLGTLGWLLMYIQGLKVSYVPFGPPMMLAALLSLAYT